MRKNILGSLTSLLIPFAAYGAHTSYGAYQRKSLARATSGMLARSNPPPLWQIKSPEKTEADALFIHNGNAVRELVLVDANVQDKHLILKQAKPGVDIVEIKIADDGVAALIQALEGYENLQAVHIVAHAEAGVMYLGGHRIDKQTLMENIPGFAAINQALREGGDLLLYGCDLAKGAAGENFLEILQQNTHADIAASLDKTGNEAFGGNWELEIQTGDIEAFPLPQSIALKDFSAVLAASAGTYNFSSGWTDTGDTLVSTHFIVGAKDANSTNSLDAAIYAAPPNPAYIQNGDSVNSYFYVNADGVDTGTFELTALTSGEYLTGQFTDVYIVGILPDNSTITSSTINGTGASYESFNFGAGQLSNFSGVQLKGFKLYFDANVVGSVPFFEFRSFTTGTAFNPADSDATLTAAGIVTEPVGLDTTIDTVGEAVDVFDFNISDGGTGDGLSTLVSQIVVNVSGTSTDAERGQVTWRLDGPDVSDVTGTYNAGADTITFSGLSINVANSGNENYTVNAYYNNTSSLTEDRTIILSVDGDTNLTVGASGTQMGTTSAVTNGTGTTIDVVATQLAFSTQPAGSVSGAALTTQPVIAARDAFGNTDVDFTETITLTEASAGTLTNNTQAATAGVATFTNLTYTATADQQGFTLTANDQDGVGSNLPTVDANAVTSDVVATKLLFTTQPAPTSVTSGAATNLSTVPVVSAANANDIVDTGYSTDITLVEVNGAGSATMTATGDTDGNGATVSITPSSGVSTFTGMQITYTNIGASETFNLRASSGGLTTADSSQFTSTTSPSVTSVATLTADGTYSIGDSIVLVVNFSEAVFLSTGTIQLMLETGATDQAATYLAGSGSSSIYFSYTVQTGDLAADLDYTGTTGLVANGDTIQSGTFIDAILTLATPGAAGSLGNAANLVVDGVRPTAGIVVSDTALAAGETTTATITFSEAITGLAIGDFTVANGALSSLSSGDGGITWTATLTPTTSVEDPANLITLDNTGVADAAGNTGTGTTNSNNYAIDTLRPTASIVVADTALAVGETTTATITFNEAVSGLAIGDFTVANGALSSLSSGDGGITWTATLTPNASVEDSSNLITLDNTGYIDAAGNTGTGTTDSNNYAIDTLRPTASIVVADTALALGETSTVTITFNEAISGLAIGDFTVANGALSSLSTGDNITWTATLTPTSVEDPTNLITLDNTGVADAAGNAGTGTTDSNNYAIDVLRPTASIVVADTALAAGETSTVTITFNEAVTGLAIGDLTVANGALSSLSSGDGGITWTATLTPTASVEDPTNLITLDNTGVADAAGNTGTGTTDSNNYAIDTLRPTASIVAADTALAAGETTTATITFSEAITGLAVGDFTVANGALSSLSSGDGGITWTATLTPDADEEDITNAITLDNTGFIDAAGNTGTGTTDSNNYAIDTLRPSASIVVADTALASGETTTVTITFNEAISGLAIGDFTVGSGALSGLSTGDGGITWTATLTPSGTSATNVITLDNTGYVDAAGNTGTGTTDSNNYSVDGNVPVNSLPAAQITDSVTQLIFSSGNGNAISVADDSSLTVVISIGNGTLTASTGGTAGISNNGTGTVTITGTAAEVNTALEGLAYTPNGTGAQTFTIQSTDTIGNVDSDNLDITVNNATLLVTSNLDTGDDETAAGSFAADQADGSGLSIREALNWARAGDTITFDLDSGTAGNQGGSITLNGNQLVVAYSNLAIDGDLDNDGSADVTISANNASRVMGINGSLSGIELTGLTLTQGSTGSGGGGLSIGASSSVTVRDSNFTNSADAGLGGGGIYGASATLTMINSTVSGNTSSTFGGGLRIVGSGATLNLINSTVSGNTTTGVGAHGGGIQYGATGSLTIVNSTISGNAANGASSDGGGLRITTGTSSIYNTTIVGNAATNNSGGVSANGTSDTFVNNVVAGNTAGAGATAAVGGSPLATGGSANDVGGTIETATNCYFGSSVTITTDTGSLNNQGTGSLLLGDLANYNGSPVQTHRPQTGSALLEAGSNADLPADTYDLDGDSNTAEALPIDANGDQRVSNIVDIGAVEGNAVPALSNVNGGGTFVENGSAIVIDNDTLVSDNDLDLLNGGNGDYSDASAVFVRNGGVVASDSFGFNDGSGISLSGGNLIKNGQTIASFDTGTAGQVTITFTNANGETPTTTDVSAILQQMTYSSSSEDPGSSADLDIILNDGAGANVTETASITITSINDAPTLTATATNPTFTENGAAVAVFSGANIGTVESGQTVTALALVVDGLTDGSSEIITIDGSSFAITNGTNGVTAGNTVNYSISMTGETATVTLTSAGLSAAVAQTLVNGISYHNLNEMPSSGNRSFTLTSITDSGGTANGGVATTVVSISSTLTMNDVNDAPVITAPASIAITEDVATALTGISFSDVDTASGTVVVTLSVASGSLTADTNQPVIIGGTSSNLTLTSNIATINAFIASSYLTFTSATDNSSDVTLGVLINDNGLTGSGGAQTDTTNVTLDVSAVNDAPVNSVPAAQDVDQDSSLVFNSGNSNLISISDSDAGSNPVEVSLTATNGLMTLSGITGLSFSTGDGTSDSTLSFTGSIANINSALSGMVFVPTGGYNGAASIQIVTNDQGWSGSGGAQSDTDTVNITVSPLNPEITAISTSAGNGIYGLGDALSFTVTFDQAVTVDTSGGTPGLLLETGTTDRSASYISGSGGTTLTFSYTVQAGDESADLDYQSTGALALNGATIESGDGDAAVLTLPATGGVNSIAGQYDVVIDGVLPTLDSSTPADNASGVARDANIVLTFSENLAAAAGSVGLYATDGDTLVESFSAANLGLAANVVTINPASNLTPSRSYYLLIDNTAFVDTAGNAYVGITANTGLNFSIANAAPVAGNDNAVTDEDMAVALAVLDNDTDADSSLNAASVLVSTAAANGSTSVNTATGVITYTPAANFNGSDSFTYTVNDVYGALSNTGTVTITVNAVNDAPTALNDLASTPEDVLLAIDVAANDTDIDAGDSVDPASLVVVAQPANGTATVNAGQVDYQPDPDFNGSDSFTYTIEDQNGAVSSVATVIVNVTGTNDLPTAVNDSATGNEDEDLDIDVLANDSDLDGTIDGTTVMVLTPAANGSTSVDALTGVITYTPSANYYGSDSFSYVVQDDASGTSNAATVTLTITSVNDAPVALNDTAIMLEETAHEVNVLGNDSDIDGTLVAASVEIVSAPASGSTSINASTGAITYTPANDFSGSDVYTYRVQDNEGLWSAPAIVTMTVDNTNDAPVANDDTVSTDENVALAITVLANDTDIDDAIDPTSVVIVAQAVSGTLMTNLNGTVSYTPDADFFGSDSFSYTVSDAYGDVSNVATVSITVDLVNTAPVISGTPSTSATVGELYSFTPSVTDPDIDDNLVFSVLNLPAWLSFNPATGALSGTPADANAGSYADIQISVDDGVASDDLAAFSIEVAEGVDTDGDTISDYQEGLDMTDPLDPTDYLDLMPPDLMAPADVTLDAFALYTPVHIKQLLGLALSASNADVDAALADLVTDNVDGDGCCNPDVENLLLGSVLLLPPGRNEVTWMAEDFMGNLSEVTQIVNVRPLVSLSKDQTTVEGATATISVILNGESPFYPFTVPFVIDDTSTADSNDHNLVAGTVTFTETGGVGQTRATISIDILTDALSEGEETLVVRLDDRTSHAEDLANGYDPDNPDIYDINSGARTRHTLRIVEGNLAPDVGLQLQQNGVSTVLVAANGGPVTVDALVSDPNPGDTHSFDWSATDNRLVDTDGDTQDADFVFDPSSLNPGRYTLRVEVTDSEGATGGARLFFLVLANLPTLSDQTDSDEDGIDDQSEGTNDTDDDGIPDYLDNITASNVIPEQADVTRSFLMECDPGVLCRLGRFALLGATGGTHLEINELNEQDDLAADPDFEPVGGIFDFEIRELPEAGQSVSIAIPLRAAIPQNAVYRKFRDGSWHDFVENANNALHSTAGDEGYCPPPGDEAWEPGLVAGHLCVQLTIEDGGPNDADGEVNAAIEDPGAVSVSRNVSHTVRSTGGGSVGFGLLLTLGLLLLAQFTRKNPKVLTSIAPMLLTAALVTQTEFTQAQDWQQDLLERSSIELAVYQTESSQSGSEFVNAMAADGVTVDLQRYDTSRTAWQLSWGYNVHERISLQVGYLDLGEVDIDFAAVAPDNATLEAALAEHYPAHADGWTVGYRFTHDFAHNFFASLDAGLYLWRSDIEVSGAPISPESDGGLDLLLGLGANYRLGEHWRVGLKLQRVFFENDDVDLLGAEVGWHF